MFEDSHKVQWSLVGILKLEPNQPEQMNNTFLVNIFEPSVECWKLVENMTVYEHT